MIRALLTGVLYGAPQSRISKTGKPFTTGKMLADSKDGKSVFCNLVAFGEQAERLLSLPADSALSVAGRAELSAYLNKSGEPAASISLTVDDIAVLKPRPRPRPSKPEPQQPGNGDPLDDYDRWVP